MDQRDIQQLYDAGKVATTVKDGDVLLVGRKNVQRGDNYSILVMDKKVLTDYIVSQVPSPPTPTNYDVGYKSYAATITQTGTAAPVATVLNSGAYNYLGAITWARTSAGVYTATLTGKFTVGKTVVIVDRKFWPTVFSGSNLQDYYAVDTYFTDVDTINLDTFRVRNTTVTNIASQPYTYIDDALTSLVPIFIEIRVYN